MSLRVCCCTDTGWEGLIRAPYHGEDISFCLYCGGVLVPDESGIEHCLRCNQNWQRCYSNLCPGCPDRQGWVHLPRPFFIQMEHGRVISATGVAWCDCCHETMLYLWTLGNVARIRLTAANGRSVEGLCHRDFSSTVVYTDS